MKTRLQIYELSDLAPGDRFYFKGDRKKKMYTVNDEKPFEVKKQMSFHIKYCNCLDETLGKSYIFQQVQFKANRQVIFIRNIHEANNQGL